MGELGDFQASWLVQQSERSLWDTAIRVRPTADPVMVLSHLARKLTVVAHQLRSHVMLYIEPTGDACDTGHWIDVTIDAGTVWADMTPWPERYGGSIPPRIDAELELAGWVAVVENPDSGPYYADGSTAEELSMGETSSSAHLMRRLIADVDDTDLVEWATLVAHASQRVIEPSARQWFLHAQIEVLDGGPLHDPPYAPTPFDGVWNIDIGQLLRPDEWERAVWRSDSETGQIACRLGLHQYHEPPCRGGETGSQEQ